jgi:hypothetical protein
MSHFSNANVWLSGLSDRDVEGIVGQIERTGIFCADDFLSQEDLARMKSFVSTSLTSAGKESVSLGSSQLAGSGLEELAEMPVFKALFSRLYTAALKRPAPDVTFYQILRCLTGKTVANHSLMFHYDSYVITALLPVEIPAVGKRGDFLLIPNTRTIRWSYLRNLADKAVIDNRFMQRHLRKRASSPSMQRVSMVPGNLYLFWGYRTIHTNEPVDEGAVRATALFHYADPHAGSFVKRSLRRA